MDSTPGRNMQEDAEMKLVLPGEYLGTAEELAPGRGTYEYKGEIYAALMGYRHVDAKAKTVMVKAIHEIPHLSEGEVVYARVEEIKMAMLVTTVLCDAASGRIVPGYPEGTVHISKAKDSYVERLNREFSVGDIVKAKVLQGHPAVRLSTQGAELGVVSARCQDCHGLLTKMEKGLVCTRCGRKEERNLSSAYGTYEKLGY
jgi:exosome complex component CSL4